jgi:hypothetical protein
VADVVANVALEQQGGGDGHEEEAGEKPVAARLAA